MANTHKEILPCLIDLNHTYQCLKVAREHRGAIEFESNETRIIFGEHGKINRIEPVQRNLAHLIIEECMLAANLATAKFFEKNKLPCLYRNHEGPSLDKLGDLRSFLNEMGLGLGGGKEPTPKDFAAVIKKIGDRPDAQNIQIALLRSLSQAIYAPVNEGHFGLAYSAYCHFTSPIRRYPDLFVHRQIRSVLQGIWKPLKLPLSSKAAKQQKQVDEDLAALGMQCSMTERRADDATRDVIRWLKCQYMAQHIGKTFEGRISGVTRFGFFVELIELHVDGLVHVASLSSDFYQFNPSTNALEGEHSGKTFKLGDLLSVCVSRVDIEERKIDFDYLDLNAKKNKKSKRKKLFEAKKPKTKEKPVPKEKIKPKTKSKPKKTKISSKKDAT